MRKVKSTSYVRGRRIRVTRGDGCGRPVYGEDSSVVSNGMISVGYTALTTETEEISVTNAAGEVCVFEPAETKVTGYGVELTMCEVDPDLFTIITGQEVYLDAFGFAVGFTVNTEISLENTGFGFELWLGAGNADACTPGSQGKYGYLLLPFLKGGILSDFTVENGAVNFVITGATTRDGNAWGVGPYNDVMLTALSVPGPLLTPLETTEHLLLIQTEVAPPEAVVGARPLMDPANTALTSVTGTEGTGYSVSFTTTPAATSPVYWDFGDGTWDYVAAPGATSHVYPTAPGKTYTAKATTNGVVRTVAVDPVA